MHDPGHPSGTSGIQQTNRQYSGVDSLQRRYPTINEIFRNRFLNFSPGHQVHELLFIASPVTLLCIVEDSLFGWREVRPMNIVNAIDLAKEETQVILLRKPTFSSADLIL